MLPQYFFLILFQIIYEQFNRNKLVLPIHDTIENLLKIKFEKIEKFTIKTLILYYTSHLSGANSADATPTTTTTTITTATITIASITTHILKE